MKKIKSVSLLEYEKKYDSRNDCAAALGVSYQHFNNMLAAKIRVAQLKNGAFITLTKYNKIFNR